MIPHFSPFDNALEVKKVKFSKMERLGLFVTALVLVFLAGWHLRGALSHSYRVSGDRLPRQAPAADAQTFTPDAPVDLNTASLSDLMALPGLGEVRSQAILDYREEKGPFTYPEDIIQVPGIGQITYEELAPYITALSP